VIYPNPNNGEFVVRSNSDISLTLINELGQIVRTVMVTESNNHTVSVSDLAKGIYFMTGQKDGAQIHQKIVVVK